MFLKVAYKQAITVKKTWQIYIFAANKACICFVCTLELVGFGEFNNTTLRTRIYGIPAEKF